MDKLPDANRAADPDETVSFLNETVVDLIKQNRCSSKGYQRNIKILKTVVPGKILETIDTAVLNADASDDEDDRFKDLRKEGEFSGGVSHAAVLNDPVDDASNNEDDVDVVDVSLTEELCTICGKRR